MLRAIETGYVQGEIGEAAYREQREVEAGHRVIVGVNQFRQAEAHPPATLRVDPAVLERQKARLARVRAGREAARGRERLTDRGVLAGARTSPFTGGATVGDRIRMQDHSPDTGVFVRGMAPRGRLGGLAPATAGVVAVLDASGCDVIFIETVGAGQGEVEVAGAADT